MALLSRHVSSPGDTQPGTTYQCHYPTRHQDSGTERIEERGRADSSLQRTEMKRWKEGDPFQDQLPQILPMKKGSNRLVPCTITNDNRPIASNRRLRP